MEEVSFSDRLLDRDSSPLNARQQGFLHWYSTAIMYDLETYKGHSTAGGSYERLSFGNLKSPTLVCFTSRCLQLSQCGILEARPDKSRKRISDREYEALVL
uniref:Uncharacterized protein n=1 Tax=Physcomitrium patens TaxID=3218 RepID=A0A2K1IHK0_PHYPA|nr:hypothetical protein PHYPA_029349 [Physcomitrium patens]